MDYLTSFLYFHGSSCFFLYSQITGMLQVSNFITKYRDFPKYVINPDTELTKILSIPMLKCVNLLGGFTFYKRIKSKFGCTNVNFCDFLQNASVKMSANLLFPPLVLEYKQLSPQREAVRCQLFPNITIKLIPSVVSHSTL